MSSGMIRNDMQFDYMDVFLFDYNLSSWLRTTDYLL